MSVQYLKWFSERAGTTSILAPTCPKCHGNSVKLLYPEVKTLRIKCDCGHLFDIPKVAA